MSKSLNCYLDDSRSIVYVIDDDEAFRMAIARLLRSVGRRVVCFPSCGAFAGCAREDVPACLILDVRLRGESGLAFQAEMQRRKLALPVIIVTGHADVAMSVKAMKAGAVDFLIKPFRDQDLIDAVTTALHRDAMRRSVDRRIATLRTRYDSLTPRELQVMRLVVSGFTNQQIASRLAVEVVTVKLHRGHVMQKMRASSLAHLVRASEMLAARFRHATFFEDESEHPDAALALREP